MEVFAAQIGKTEGCSEAVEKEFEDEFKDRLLDKFIPCPTFPLARSGSIRSSAIFGLSNFFSHLYFTSMIVA